MKELLKEIEDIEEQMRVVEKDYADECTALYNQEGFDYYNAKWQKKLAKIASRYADLLLPLKDKHKMLRIEANQKEEQIRRSKYRETY